MPIAETLFNIMPIAQAGPSATTDASNGTWFWLIFVVIFPLILMAYMVWVIIFARKRRRIGEDYIQRLITHMERNEEQLDRIANTLNEIAEMVKEKGEKP